jgi:hypothetical protein
MLKLLDQPAKRWELVIIALITALVTSGVGAVISIIATHK